MKYTVSYTDEALNEAQEALTQALQTIFPEDLFDDSSEATADRVMRFWLDFAHNGEELPFKFTTFPAESSQLVCVQDIEFASVCAHHLLPFYGKAHVAYIPNKTQVGLSKIPRLVNFYAKRPQVQEHLAEQIAKRLKNELDCHGIMVILQARHTCMSCRGAKAHNALMTTSVVKGIFLSNPHAKQEFLDLISIAKI